MADEAPQDKPQTRPKKEPHGPGVLIIFGVALLLLAGYCLIDVTRQSGRELTFIVLNWGGAIVSAVAAVYCFALAVVRSRRSKAGPPDSGTPG
jgi:predicted Co/Zn/Cd cation transporter (cation efflux family)